MGQLRQNRNAYNDQRVLDVVLQGYPEVWDIQKQMDALYVKEDFNDADGDAFAKLQERFDELDGYNQETVAAEVLTNLGVNPDLHDKDMGDLDDACGFVCCWPRPSSHVQMCCCWTNQPMTSISRPLPG